LSSGFNEHGSVVALEPPVMASEPSSIGASRALNILPRQFKQFAGRSYWTFKERYWQDFVFVHINRTGGTSIERALGARHTHRTAREIRTELGSRHFDSKFSFSVVRNPWDKVVSQYHNLLTRDTGWGEPPAFNIWVEASFVDHNPLYFRSRMMLPQVDWLSDQRGQILVQFVARFETLHEDFRFIRRRIGRSASLPHLNASNRKDYREYYDERSFEIVKNWAKSDIKRFNYSFH
jgi:chondroitin 4-sulfotransferase 11